MRFIWPLDDHIITRDFYYLSSIYIGGQHAATDLIRATGTTIGSPIKAVADGTVVGVGWDFYSGFFVAIDHADGWRSFYRHLFGQTPVVVGQQVNQGQIIGNIGNTGYSLGAHLHFDLWNRGRQSSEAFYKNGWWAHDSELYLQEDDMPTIEERLRRIEGDLEGAYSQISWLRAELNQSPQFDSAQAHDSVLYALLDRLTNHTRDADYHHSPGEIQAIVGTQEGLDATEARAIAQAEDSRLKITKD